MTPNCKIMNIMNRLEKITFLCRAPFFTSPVSLGRFNDSSGSRPILSLPPFSPSLRRLFLFLLHHRYNHHHHSIIVIIPIDTITLGPEELQNQSQPARWSIRALSVLHIIKLSGSASDLKICSSRDSSNANIYNSTEREVALSITCVKSLLE